MLINQTIDNLDISSIGVEGYDGSTGENIRYGITDKKRINKLKKKLVLQQMEKCSGNNRNKWKHGHSGKL